MVGGFLLLGGNASVAWAEQRVPSGLAALLIGVMPIWMVGLEWSAAARAPASSGRRAFSGGTRRGVARSLPRPERKRVDLLGAAALVLASASWAWGSVISKSAPLPPSPFLATSMEMIAGGIICLIVAVLAGSSMGSA